MRIIWLVVTEQILVTCEVPALGEGIIVHPAFLQMKDINLVGTYKALNLQLFGDWELCLPHTVDVSNS